MTELIDTHIDVTEQHLAREALQKAFDEIKQSEDRLRLVIDTIPTLVWRAGPDGVPDFLNQTALDYTGLSLDQAGTGWPRAFHPDDKKGVLVKWAAICESVMPDGHPACRGGRKPVAGPATVNSACSRSKPCRCAMSRATLLDGTDRLPTSR